MIVFYGEIQKLDARRKLLSFLDAKTPILCTFLHHLWDRQQRAITYKEIREAILRGDIDHAWIEQWQQDYSNFVIETMKPIYTELVDAATADLARRFMYFESPKDYTEKYSAQFVTNSTATQINGLRAVIHKAVNMRDMSVDSLSKVIRPMIGLDAPQTLANMRYYQKLIDGGMKQKEALSKSIIYGGQQHRYRAWRMSRTEMSFAYNNTRYENVQECVNQGWMGHTVKQWSAGLDPRTCKYCKALDGMQIELDELFPFRTKLPRDVRKTPPAHPNCRCTLLYVEKEPPKFGADIRPTEVSDTRHLEIIEDLADR